MKQEATDVAVIGAGPIGIEMAVALEKAGIDYVVFDKKQIAHTISWFPRMMTFFSSADRIAIAGVPIPRADQSKCTKEDYLAYLRSIVIQFDLNINTYEEVISAERRRNGKFSLRTLRFAHEKSYVVNTIIIATGEMHAPKMLGIPGENLPHVSHYFDDPHTYFRQRLLIVGGKNSAVEAALRCFHCGADVALSYRGADLNPKHVKYWLLPELKGLIERGRIRFYPNTVPREIDNGSVTIARRDDGTVIEIGADFVLLLTGYCADMNLFKTVGVELRGSAEKPLFDAKTMETNVPGVFVAGTAAAGTQDSYKIFIENCHIHVAKIMAALSGASPPASDPLFPEPES